MDCPPPLPGNFGVLMTHANPAHWAEAASGVQSMQRSRDTLRVVMRIHACTKGFIDMILGMRLRRFRIKRYTVNDLKPHQCSIVLFWDCYVCGNVWDPLNVASLGRCAQRVPHVNVIVAGTLTRRVPSEEPSARCSTYIYILRNRPCASLIVVRALPRCVDLRGDVNKHGTGLHFPPLSPSPPTPSRVYMPHHATRLRDRGRGFRC